MADGHLNICKECVKTRVKKHRHENDSVREYDRWRYQNTKGRKEQFIKNANRWRETNPIAYKAHTALNNAVRDKKIVKQPCSICGDVNSHAHHADYNQPLNVEWLCAKHHQRKHHRSP
jgi:hypothetical protein